MNMPKTTILKSDVLDNNEPAEPVYDQAYENEMIERTLHGPKSVGKGRYAPHLYPQKREPDTEVKEKKKGNHIGNNIHAARTNNSYDFPNETIGSPVPPPVVSEYQDDYEDE